MRSDATIQIGEEMVKQLLASQHPDMSHLALKYMDQGWDNALFSLGSKYLVRLPRRKIAAQLIKNEQTWLPIIAKKLPLPTPVPFRIGKPDKNYPYNWSILPWFKGQTAAEQSMDNDQALIYARFLKALHFSASHKAPKNPLRGVLLQKRAKKVEEGFIVLKSKTNLISKNIEIIWEDALKTTPNDTPCWIHGDLHPKNIIVEKQKIQAIIDWGDLTAGDPATDLASIWMLYNNIDMQHNVMKTYNLSETLLARAKGWAVFFGVIFTLNGLQNNTIHYHIGKQTLENLNKA